MSRIFEYLVDRLLAQCDRVVDLDFELAPCDCAEKVLGDRRAQLELPSRDRIETQNAQCRPLASTNSSGSDSRISHFGRAGLFPMTGRHFVLTPQ